MSAAQLADSAQLLSARRAINDAIGELASRPLDERAIEAMRTALDQLGEARETYRRLGRPQPGRPHLTVIKEESS